MRPWVKAPVDLLEFPGVHALHLTLRWTYASMFLRARRLPNERLGWLLDERDQPASVRTIAEWSGIPKSTAQDHIVDLLGRGMLQRDLGGKLIVPLVVVLERRFARRSPSATAVDNSDAVVPLDPAAVRLSGLDPGISDTHSLHEVQTLRELRSTDVVEIPEAEPVFAIDLAPPEITDPDVRYALGRLAEASEPWARSLGRANDRRNLARLAVENPGELLSALRMQLVTPTARNPLAWLNTTVTDLASEGVAS